MRLQRAVATWIGGLCLALTMTACAGQAPPSGTVFVVELDAARPAGGRLLVFAVEAGAARAAARGGKVEEVDADPIAPEQVAVAAREVSRIEPGRTVRVDADQQAFPSAFSALPPGDYLVQAVLDVDHSYNYTGRGAGDLVGDVVELHLPAARVPLLKLTRTLPAHDGWLLPPAAPQEVREALPAARAHTTPIAFSSAALGAFWGRPIAMRGWVLTPPGYDAKAATRYPTVYYTHGFTGNAARMTGVLAAVYAMTAKGLLPPMIWVFLDESSATGTHEFADSVNNGPWGQALTTELIPYLEAHYRMDARASGRFLNGHSSGGWATLWLQTRYPRMFGGTWSTSPDPSDFHDFVGVDLYAAGANVYRQADGAPRPLVRDHARVLGSFEEFARLERVLGPYGGQLASFEWVFSPRGADGRPQPMFDRDTGAVDPQVAAYWSAHYDIARRLREQWPRLGADLDGKIHLYVGTADTFYLDGSAHRLKAVLDGLGAKSDIRFLPGKTHFDLYAQGDDRMALLKDIAWQMYGIARPQAKRPAAAAP